MKNTKLKKLIILALIALSSLSMIGCNNNSSDSNKQGIVASKETEKKTLFKDMKTVDLNGNEIDGSIFSQNKLTLVNVWNTGCTPCIDEIPILDEINKDYADKGVSVKGLVLQQGKVLTDKEKQEVSEILEKSKATYDQFVASEEMLSSETFKNIDAFPTTFFIDSNGNIVDSIEGSGDYKQWQSRIDKVLKELQ